MTTPEKALEELGLTASFRFVPESAPDSTLGMFNWEVTLSRKNWKGKEVSQYKAVFRYSEGIGFLSRRTLKEIGCFSGRRTVYQQSVLKALLETGRSGTHKVREPELTDVCYSLVSDAGVLDYPGFEDWACEYCYDPDSRKAEKTYRECLEQSLRLRNLIGEEGIRLLKEAFRDY